MGRQAKQQTANGPPGAWPTGRYRLQQAHYMAARPDAEHATVLREGAEVSFAGRPSQFMTPLDEGARQAVAQRQAELAQDREASFAPDALLAGLSARQLQALAARLRERSAAPDDRAKGGGDER
jgi:hypothetical protein